ELVQAQEAWREYGYKGNGMVVGVIDTGIDPDHQDMILSDETEVDLTESKVNRIKADNELPGSYYTEKVPYAYNYMDEDEVIG
ncbi:S8 family serine peptidase, partial [Mycobacterium tuberculosis]|nr:S8 family serine peptidase [Mycobacterium tuberculosis]